MDERAALDAGDRVSAGRDTQEVRMLKRGGLAVLFVVLSFGVIPAAAQAAEALVNTGSPSTPFPQNKQNEPTVAIDPTNPSVLVAG
jgi:hypothetical protein